MNLLKKKMGYTSQKGITLIALVVTIIVLLILAAVTISMVLGEEGIIKQAQNAEIENRGATVEELKDLWKTGGSLETNYGIDGNVQTLEALLDDLVSKGLLTESEKEDVLEDEELEVRIGSRTINFKQDTSDGATSSPTPGFILEVNEYVTGYNLICIYTNNENVAYALNGVNLYDITDSGYTYNGETYNKVYGYVTAQEVSAEDFTELDASTVTIEEVIYDYDINCTGVIDSNDYSHSSGFIYAWESHYENVTSRGLGGPMPEV